MPKTDHEKKYMTIEEKILRMWTRRRKKLSKYFKRKEKMVTVAIKTKHAPWIRYRTVTVSDTILTATTKKGGNVPTSAYNIPEAMNNVEIRLSASLNSPLTATAYFFGARYLDRAAGTYDDISLIGTAALTTGAQVSTDDYFYVGSVILTDRWITEVNIADGNGNDGMSRIAFDASGYDCFFVQLTVSSGTWLIDLSGW